MSIEDLIQQLHELKLDLPVSARRFEEVLADVAALNDPRCIGLLLGVFPKDDKGFSELMFSIVHTIERFDDSTYVAEIIKSFPTFATASPYWSTVLHMRIFNNPGTFAEYKTAISHCGSQRRQPIWEFLNELSRDPKFKSACQEVLNIL
jgi:hypothetical protein